ncbi:MAG: beta family protein [Pseudonocardia sp.]|nr:beta family protein [Pseudonocardia sp.]
MADALYVPVLKGKPAELTALTLIQPATRSRVLPLVEFVPGPDPEDVKRTVDRTIKGLKKISGFRLMLDTGLLDPSVDVAAGRNALGYAVESARGVGIPAVPVVRLGDDERSIRAARDSDATSGTGVAVRLSFEDLDDDPDVIATSITGLLDRLGLDRPDADIVLDVGAVDSERAAARLVRDVIGELDAVDKWRTLIVTAGAFPADLSAVSPWEVGALPRRDALLWDHIRRRRTTRLPLFGDYAVAHPLLSTGTQFRAAPQLRYTVSDRWLAIKGKVNDPRGHDQFYEICEMVTGHPEFAGAALGTADTRIATPRARDPGNATTWRALGTAHHLDLVVQRLTNLGEP